MRECACGCGQTFKKTSYRGIEKRFVSGHNNRQPAEQRFWKYVRKDDYCWEWLGAKGKKGYGIMSLTATKNIQAHRLAWELHFGPIPDKKHVLHRCDNPGCVNPEHLFIGTTQDNSKDMVAKGRQRKGEKHQYAKLKDADIPIIRSLGQQGVSNEKIAKMFGVQRRTIWDLLHGKTWKHL